MGSIQTANQLKRFQSILSSLALIGLSVGFSLQGFNSDALYAYSQARDIWQFGSLQGWTFSAISFSAPDVLLSIPLAGFIHSPYLFYCITAPLQIFLLVWLYSIYRSNLGPKQDFGTIFILTSISVSLTAVLLAVVIGDAFYFTVEPFFIFVHHGFAALCSIFIFLLCKEDDFAFWQKHPIATILVLSALVYSDFFFGLYLGAFIATTISKKRPKSITVLFLFAVLCISIFILDLYLNPSLGIQTAYSLFLDYDKWQIILNATLIVIPALALGFHLHKKHLLSNDLRSLLLGSLIVVYSLCLGGILKDLVGFRYLCILFPATAFLLVEVLISLNTHSTRHVMPLLLVSILSCTAYSFYQSKDRYKMAFVEELACIQELQSSHPTMIARYWPAKMIFESTNRQVNLIQINEKFERNNWIYNSRWSTIFPEGNTSIVVTSDLGLPLLKNIQANFSGRLTCQDKLLIIDKGATEVLGNH